MAIVNAPAVLAVGMGNGVKIGAVRWFDYLDKAFVEHLFDPSLLRDEFRNRDATDAFGRRASAGVDVDRVIERQTVDGERVSRVLGEGG